MTLCGTSNHLFGGTALAARQKDELTKLAKEERPMIRRFVGSHVSVTFASVISLGACAAFISCQSSATNDSGAVAPMRGTGGAAAGKGGEGGKGGSTGANGGTTGSLAGGTSSGGASGSEGGQAGMGVNGTSSVAGGATGSAGSGGTSATGGSGGATSTPPDASSAADVPIASDASIAPSDGAAGGTDPILSEGVPVPGRPDKPYMRLCDKAWTQMQCCAFLCKCMNTYCTDSPMDKPRIGACMDTCMKVNDMRSRCLVYHCFESKSPTAPQDHPSHCGHASGRVGGGACPAYLYQ